MGVIEGRVVMVESGCCLEVCGWWSRGGDLRNPLFHLSTCEKSQLNNIF